MKIEKSTEERLRYRATLVTLCIIFVFIAMTFTLFYLLEQPIGGIIVVVVFSILALKFFRRIIKHVMADLALRQRNAIRQKLRLLRGKRDTASYKAHVVERKDKASHEANDRMISALDTRIMECRSEELHMEALIDKIYGI